MAKLNLFTVEVIALLNLLVFVPLIGIAAPLALPQKIERSQVVLVGEMHYFTPIESYELLLSQIKASANRQKCLAVEFPQSNEPFESVLSDLKQRSNLIRQDGTFPQAKEAADAIDMAVSEYSKLSILAEKYNFVIVPVENPDKMNLDLSVDQRNQSIASNIAEALRTKKCDRILGIFGKVHLSLGLLRTTTVQSLLKNDGIVAQTINLQMTNEDGIDESYKSFNQSGLQARQTDFKWLRNATITREIKLLPSVPNESSTWQQFDYTFLIPSQLKPIHY